MSIEAAFFGSLGKNAEQKTSASGKRYLRLSVRVGDGDAAQWLSVLAFDPAAIEVADKLVQRRARQAPERACEDIGLENHHGARAGRSGVIRSSVTSHRTIFRGLGGASSENIFTWKLKWFTAIYLLDFVVRD